MTPLPEGLVRTLEALVPSTPFVLFLRHAERHPLPPENPYADVDLTPNGHEAALELGRMLRTRTCWAAISPFLRCQRTAEALVERPDLIAPMGSRSREIVEAKYDVHKVNAELLHYAGL